MYRSLLSFRHRRAPEVVKHPVEMYFTFSSCTPCCQFFFVSEILGQSLETAWLRPLDINGADDGDIPTPVFDLTFLCSSTLPRNPRLPYLLN